MKARLKYCVTSGVAVAHLALVRPANAGGCEKDGDCKGDRICENAVCVAPSTKSEPAVPATGSAAPPATADSSASPPVLGDALPARTPAVQASFASQPGSAFEVSVEDAEGAKRCVAPCSLQVSPGAHLVEVRGSRTFSSRVDVPANGGSFDIQTATHPSRGKPLAFLVIGIGLLGAGIYGATQENLLLGLTGIMLGASTTAISTIFLVSAKPSGADTVILHGATVSRRPNKPTFIAAPTRDGVVGSVQLSF